MEEFNSVKNARVNKRGLIIFIYMKKIQKQIIKHIRDTLHGCGYLYADIYIYRKSIGLGLERREYIVAIEDMDLTDYLILQGIFERSTIRVEVCDKKELLDNYNYANLNKII